MAPSVDWPVTPVAGLPFSSRAAGVTLRLLTPADFSELRDGWYGWMLADEPMTRTLGGHAQRDERMDAQLLHVCEEGVSVVAVDVATGAIVGMFVNHVLDRATGCGPPAAYVRDCLFPPVHATLMDCCVTMYHPADVFARFPGLDRLFDCFYLGVAPSHRGRGISHDLTAAALLCARQRGCGAAVVFASSDGTRGVTSRAGFEVRVGLVG